MTLTLGGWDSHGGGGPLVAKLPRLITSEIVGLDAEQAGYLLELIEAESLLDESQFKGAATSTEPFTEADVARGMALFTGHEKLKGGSAMCMSCHRMSGIGGLGGGNLGPDLTRVYEKGQHTTGGRAVLSAWLMAPSTATMQPIFKDHPMTSGEINALAAYFESTMAERPADSSTSRVAFLLTGLAGAVLGVFFLDAIWSRRFHSVRKSLVEANTSRGKS